MTNSEFKTRYNVYESSFNLEYKKSAREFSLYCIETKKRNHRTHSWKLIKECKPYPIGHRVFNLQMKIGKSGDPDDGHLIREENIIYSSHAFLMKDFNFSGPK